MNMNEVNNELVIFNSDSGEVQVNIDAKSETVWLSQLQMSQVFSTSTDNIGLHIKNIFSDGELDEASTTEEFSVLRPEGQRQVKLKGAELI